MLKTLLTTALLGTIALPFGGGAHRKTEEGNRHYVERRFDEALRAYTEAQVDAPEAPELYYDLGNVFYRQGDYEGAAEAYSRALILGASDALVPAAAYNLGNARYRQQEFEEAIKAYQRALEADPADTETKRNLELALRALEEQEQQQQQDQDQDQSEEKDDSGDPPQDQQQQDQEDQEDQEQDQQQQPDSENPEEKEDPQSGEEGSQEQQPDRMTPEQAERLLDSLAEEERKNLREEALRQQQGRSPAREKDW